MGLCYEDSMDFYKISSNPLKGAWVLYWCGSDPYADSMRKYYKSP